MKKLLMQLSGLGEEKKKIDRTICPYCYQFHSKDQLVENLCPKMIEYAKAMADKQSYQCKECFGQGSFEKKIQTKIYQTNKKYQQRLQVWRDNGETEQKPQRKILKEQKLEQIVQCKKCIGKGKIYKVCYKKSINSRQPVNQVNQCWVEQKMKGQKGDKELYCSICMEHNETTTISLNCSHSFHLKCLYIWLKTSKTCPMCRKIDPFLDLNLVSDQIKEPVSVVMQRGNRTLTTNQIGQQIERRNNYYNYNMVADDPHPRSFNFGFGSHYSEDQEDW